MFLLMVYRSADYKWYVAVLEMWKKWLPLLFILLNQLEDEASILP